MIRLDDNKLEMAMITYNRSDFLEEWLLHCLDSIIERNIRLVIYDSSTDGKTYQLIQEINRNMKNYSIQYEYVDPKVWVGHVVLLAIMSAKTEYVWVVGDSRYHDFSELDDKVFPALRKGTEQIVLHILNNDENDGKVYENRDEMLRDCFLSMTCTGLYIYKRSVFKEFDRNSRLKESCDKKYSDNYAFTWMGYFLEAYAQIQGKTQFCVVKIYDILPQKKIQRWYTRFYRCWCGDLCDLMAGLSEFYHNTDEIIRKTWIYMNLDSPMYCYEVKNRGDLTPETYEKYDTAGYWEKCTDNVEIIKKYAYASNQELQILNEEWERNEKDSFRVHCTKVFKEIGKDIEESEICVYGAGIGGRIVLGILQDMGLNVCCFYDQKYMQLGEVMGIEVRNPAEMRAGEYIMVSLMHYRPVRGFLGKLGISNERILYPKETWGE